MLNLLGYIDPAATTALISSLTAIGVAVGATFIIFWRKLKKFVYKMLRIDENAGKIVEDELVVYDEEVLANLQKSAEGQIVGVLVEPVANETGDETVTDTELKK